MAATIAPSIITNPVYRTVGIILAILSGVLIGVSFIFKKKGLITSRIEGKEDGHAYLKSTMWWLGMILMALGEVANFVAYALTPAVLVTPLGALSVVVSAVLSSFFLNEKLNFHGKLGCFISLLGVIVVVLNAPEQNAPDEIEEFMKLALAPGFLVYTVVIILGSIILVWKVAPKYGKTHPMVYISICSFIGSLSVCTLQALGGSIIRTFYGDNQFTHWFIYILIVFVVVTILTQINFLNKALNEFVTAEVTPVYYVVFTTATLVSSAVLYQGFKATPVAIVTLILAFLTICSGVIILQTSRMYEASVVNEDGDSLLVVEKAVSVPDVAIEMEAEQPVNFNISTHKLNPRTNSGLTRDSASKGTSPPGRGESGNSSASNISPRSSVLHKIGTALNFEVNDHLKPRTVFSNEQLEESKKSPRVSRSVSAAITRTNSTQASNTTSQISFNLNTPRTFSNPTFISNTPRNAVPNIKSNLDSTRIPPPQAIPEPVLSTKRDSARKSPVNSLIFPKGAINEEPESYTTALASPSHQL